MEANSLIVAALAAITEHTKYQTAISVKFENDMDRSVLDVRWNPPTIKLRTSTGEEVAKLGEALRKATENPGETFEVEQ